MVESARNKRLFVNYAADDAAASISGRVAHVVVLASVDDDCSAPGMKDRIRFILIERNRIVEYFEIKGATCGGVQVWHIAGVSRT